MYTRGFTSTTAPASAAASRSLVHLPIRVTHHTCVSLNSRLESNKEERGHTTRSSCHDLAFWQISGLSAYDDDDDDDNGGDDDGDGDDDDDDDDA